MCCIESSQESIWYHNDKLKHIGHDATRDVVLTTLPLLHRRGPRHDWRISEMSIDQAYDDWAASYDSDRNLTRDLDERVMRDTFASLHCDAILELGCGTGKNTAFLSGCGKRLIALDLSEGMIKRAREKVSTNQVVFAIADITKPWPCKMVGFDLIAANLVLEHVEELSPIFNQARVTLTRGGLFFVSELHPFRQYAGTKANFQRGTNRVEIQAYVHHISDFVEAALKWQFSLLSLKEWWHETDENNTPRLVTFMFERR